jgi:hypothetical protein
MAESNAGFKWFVGIAITALGVWQGWLTYELNRQNHEREEQRYLDEQYEKSRVKVEAVYKEDTVELTIGAMDNGFYLTEKKVVPRKDWEKTLKEVRAAPPVPRLPGPRDGN